MRWRWIRPLLLHHHLHWQPQVSHLSGQEWDTCWAFCIGGLREGAALRLLAVCLQQRGCCRHSRSGDLSISAPVTTARGGVKWQHAHNICSCDSPTMKAHYKFITSLTRSAKEAPLNSRHQRGSVNNRRFSATVCICIPLFNVYVVPCLGASNPHITKTQHLKVMVFAFHNTNKNGLQGPFHACQSSLSKTRAAFSPAVLICCIILYFTPNCNSLTDPRASIKPQNCLYLTPKPNLKHRHSAIS